ncbi:hypothetical protein B0H66DRAFT_607606 [Apodospora peruviana]|uniref:DUF676 domain-containing protein n=1 Tax=Apodospora peruviana TaxID=516989 RepID=A0AAE0HXK0_9PEZI|nr:hypothetical protein B0H66DRAFT_607606 [Apodospora peruviana]
MSRRRHLVLETIYDPDEVGNGPADLDLVLVHGLNGDYEKTWTHEKTKVFWPRDLLPKKQPHTRVLSFSFNADIWGNTSVAGIRENARALLATLSDEREELEENERPIVFLAHSLGGLVVKQALCTASIETQYLPIAFATRGLMFYGTPHAGAEQDRWLAIAKSFAPLAPPARGRSRVSALVEALETNSKDIAGICEDFRCRARNYAIVSFFETFAWPGTSSTIVGRMSALMNLDHEDQVPLDAHHMDLCRFESERDPAFKRTYLRIKKAAKGNLSNGGQAGAGMGGGVTYNQYVIYGGQPPKAV